MKEPFIFLEQDYACTTIYKKESHSWTTNTIGICYFSLVKSNKKIIKGSHHLQVFLISKQKACAKVLCRHG